MKQWPDRNVSIVRCPYFLLDPDNWESPDQEKKLEVPVGIHVYGSGEFGANGEIVEMENFYDVTDFFDFKPSDTDFSVHNQPLKILYLDSIYLKYTKYLRYSLKYYI